MNTIVVQVRFPKPIVWMIPGLSGGKGSREHDPKCLAFISRPSILLMLRRSGNRRDSAVQLTLRDRFNLAQPSAVRYCTNRITETEGGTEGFQCGGRTEDSVITEQQIIYALADVP